MILRSLGNDLYVRVNCESDSDFLLVNGADNYISLVDFPFSKSGFYKKENDFFVVDSEKENLFLAKEELDQCLSYMSQTDWVEPYKLRHDLGIDKLLSDSNKWKIITKREEMINRIRALSEVLNAS